MSGYTMVKQAASDEGWSEAADIKDGTTWVYFTRGDARVEMWLDTSRAGPRVHLPRNSVLGAHIYEEGKLVGVVQGSGKVDQLKEYLKDGILP